MFKIPLFLSNLKTKKIAQKVAYMQSTNSTNTAIYEMLLNDEVKIKDVLIAEQQTHGKGRRGDKWLSSKDKSLTFSFIINSEELSINKLSLLIGISIIKGIQKAANIRCKLKWPNDIMYENKKLGGVLIEKKRTHYIIGVGLNVNDYIFDSSIKSRACSIYSITNNEISRELLLAEIFNSYEQIVNKDIAQIIKIWESFCNHMNTFVKFHHSKKIVNAKFSGLNKHGNAIMSINDNQEIFNSGIIEL